MATTVPCPGSYIPNNNEFALNIVTHVIEVFTKQIPGHSQPRMLSTALRSFRPCCGNVTQPRLAVPFHRKRAVTQRLAHRETVRVAARPSPDETETSDYVTVTLRELSKGITQCKSLRELVEHYNNNSAQYDNVCVAAMWVTLANLPGDPAERQAFARRHLLGKTLATVHLMEARALANVLWALGKLRIDLTKEGQGHYLAGIFEDRVQEVVRRGALKVSRVAEQLWYGITLSGYPWSRELLESLVEKTIPVFTTWELKTQGQVLIQISELLSDLKDEQRQRLAKAVEEAVGEWDLGEEQPRRSATSTIVGMEKLRLPVSAACTDKLHTLVLSLSPHNQVVVGARGLAFCLMSLIGMRLKITAAQAGGWEGMLLRAWEAAVQRGNAKLEHFGLMIKVLLAVPEFTPSQQLKELLAEVAVERSASLSQREAGRVKQAAEAWGVALPPEVVQRLGQRAPGASRSSRAAGGRGSGMAEGRAPRGGNGRGGARIAPLPIGQQP